MAPRLQNLGTHTFPVSTKSASTQRFINQGLNLAYAFNHAEARRAFREAARLSPNLAMAYWGQALVLGPNINALMEPNDEPHALELVKKAQSLKGTATPREQALIDALAARYSGTPEHRTTNDRAYADAMRKVHQRFPDDPDIAMLYVESMMDLRPWGYWMPDGRPHEGTAEIVALTERVMRKYPKHPGALHMYVHLVEPTSTPERAEKAADTLLTLMPAAGHMVHMPSHIYQRVGRYADAMESNRLAVAADEDYIAQCRAQGLYPMGYYPHNVHFLWFAAAADGQSKVAIDAARKVASRVEEAQLAQLPMLAGFRVVPYWAHVRFGQWQEMLAEPEPPAGSRVPARRVALRARPGLRRHRRCRRGGARARRSRRGPARQEPRPAALLTEHRHAPSCRSASPVLAGEIAAARGEFPTRHRPPGGGRAPRGCARVHRAVRVAFAVATRARCHPARGRSPGRGRDGLLGRTSSARATTAGPSSASSRRSARRARTPRPRLPRLASRRRGHARTSR